jgi:hypothetical protein
MGLDITAIATIAGAGIIFLVFRQPLAGLMNRYLRWYYGPAWRPSVNWSNVYTVAGVLALLTVAGYVIIALSSR